MNPESPAADSRQRPSLQPADLVWRDGVPESRQFGDVYFCRDNGLEESRYVFIDRNQLPERFAGLAPGASFVVAECGFGTGLNFLATWQAWRRHAPADSGCLHYVTIEKHPLTVADLTRALALWPELAGFSAELLAQYPPLVEGVHRLVFDSGRVRLTVFFGDAQDGWEQLEFTADAWYLDGFAPARNPELWRANVITAVRQHSKAGTTVATFTSVGEVRRALAGVGFTMSKVPGYGRKRDMLTGILGGNASELDGEAKESTEYPRRRQPPRSVAIIGSGIAGCTLARNLAERGVAVHLIDETTAPGSAASGNLQGALYVKLGVQFNYQTRLALAALLFSQRYYSNNAADHWHPCGLLQLAGDEREQQRQAKFIAGNRYPDAVLQPVDSDRATELCGVDVPRGGLWFPDSGWLEPGQSCRALARHRNIQGHFGHRVTRLTPCNGRWHIAIAGKNDLVTDHIVICAGHQSPGLIPVAGGFRFRTIRGQVSLLEAARLKAPKAVICGNRYLNPVRDGICLTGATFDLHSDDAAVTEASHQENISELEGMLPGIWQGEAPAPEDMRGRVGFRCTTHDYQPAAGPLCGPDGHELEGISLFTGLGSKGLSYAPLLAEYLADRLTGQPLALPKDIAARLNPDRCRVPAHPVSTATA
ncbi:bifunctional tRNA (5-methylaminomethyl-2-thiouridine)(34)-methyltransferase MnmD/FAD-dependent 5-carboxymethylaminomethyl-2-thiouridine(34) oxidoreductase MnmC [Marinobacter profundi]|uniref:tRNA 5-methylaminomethyl-2-thiouridine biosynthesis bifunctional protein MnmC n=1 Tax=Marinobacter profundi TaxID=2666256 RepID=A0A2G1UQT3_9GAMM|nr:bifunctional tRNA (5-methylaminomethyl-2-thiouridine)(34)-methyltransferase MnmD/FAD-dependent 5-carboxymethylaminomethyl-2-thiouridine(34) oxidoreductase MnmC [Marinobacter profundi]PHQ16832.1 bifunctional tRNA (5-methylaminomethyl-2-thiouridine)(34)-methyltransferase MnmD/FAD-dependent 5-carboxymethylaminomethyl-2-thiouridine(34) oxidoreductase MnmC [Marinobacter profundi]